MNNIKENLPLFTQIMDLLENHLGIQSEIVLHDNTQPYEHTILDIRNGYISQRKVGDGGGAWGLEVLSSENTPTHRYNKVMISDTGKLIRNSSIFFQDENGKNIGSLCLNSDITDLVNIANLAQNYSLYNPSQIQREEHFVNDVNRLLDNLLEDCRRMIPKNSADFSKEEKCTLIRYLNQKGAFLITKSGDRICNYLNISKFTLYNYLDQIKKEDNV